MDRGEQQPQRAGGVPDERLADIGVAAIFAHLPLPMALMTGDAPHFTVVAVNRAFEASAGHPATSIIGQPIAAAFPPATAAARTADQGRLLVDGQSWADICRRVADTGETTRFAVRGGHLGDGWFILHAFRAGDSPAAPVGLLFYDLTSVEERDLARANAEMVIRSSEERYRLIVESTLDYAIFTMDAAGIIDSWPPGAASVFGWTPSEAIGQPGSILFTPEDRRAGTDEAELQEARAKGVAPDVRWHICKDRHRVFIEGTTRSFSDGRGGVRGFLKVGQDVTERRELWRSALAAHAEADIARREVEQRVRERTVELAEANASLEASMREVERTEVERNILRRQLELATEEERRRLSRELHDEVGQHLTALGLGLRALSDMSQPGSEVDRRATRLIELSEALGRELHALAVRLRPKSLDDFGLESALSAHVKDWSVRNNITTDTHINLGDTRLSPEVESAIYRIAQEALTNIAKHSEASRASLLAERLDGVVRVIIEDDGRGFDTQVGKAGIPHSDRLGLRGMRERALLLGGSLEVESTPGSGTTLFIRIPLDAAKTKGDRREGPRAIE